MKTLFAVPWIEVEYGWGSRPEGYKIFDSLESAKSQSIKDTLSGNSSGGYLGPVRPIQIIETVDEMKNSDFPFFVDNIKFRGDTIYI